MTSPTPVVGSASLRPVSETVVHRSRPLVLAGTIQMIGSTSSSRTTPELVVVKDIARSYGADVVRQTWNAIVEPLTVIGPPCVCRNVIGPGSKVGLGVEVFVGRGVVVGNGVQVDATVGGNGVFVTVGASVYSSVGVGVDGTAP